MEFDTFIDSSKTLGEEYFEQKFSELEAIDNPAKRGRYFDYFVGLLFNQLTGVKVYVGKEVSTGEVDVFVTCLDAPDWLYRLVGEATLLENKWREKPTSTDAISVFHDKASWATLSCKVCYFVSMNGFTSKRKTSAEQLIRSKTNPKMVGWTRDDILQMVREGSPEQLLRMDVM